jgi:transposase
VEGLKAQVFIANRGYDTDAIVEGKQKEGMEVVIPPRAHRKVQRHYDEYLYKLRHLVENAFLTMKQWRGIATRYAKRLSSYLACVQIRCLYTWLTVIS